MNEQQHDAADKLADSLRAWGFDFETFRNKAKASVESGKGDLSEVNGVLR